MGIWNFVPWEILKSNIPSFFPLFLHGLPSSWTCRAVCFFHPLAGCGESPPKSETPEWQSLCFIACHQEPSPKKRPRRIHYCTLETLEPLAGAGAGRFPGITAPWHGRRAGKKPSSLASDIDLLSSKRVNEIHTSCKMPKVGSIGLFLVKTISSESLPLLQNHLFLLPWCSLRSSQD